VDAIYFDISSAFDIIPHVILLHILGVLGIRDGFLSWFLS
jgi:hypothetical protein